MPVISRGRIPAPGERSKLDSSEGQKNRIAREAMWFLNTIESELDPDGFSHQEIVDEHLAIPVGTRGDESQYLRYVSLYLNFLVEKGYVVVDDDEKKTYHLAREMLLPPVVRDPIV